MKKAIKKITTVHEHPRHVPISQKNPDGITIVDQHLRRLEGTYLSRDQLKALFISYKRTGLISPSHGKLSEYKNADKYDDLIAVWTDYFNKKLNVKPPLDPDLIKALIGSESGFDPDPKKNRIAFGLTQITKQTLKALQDPNGECKDFIFSQIRQKDLKDPDISIPLAIRWLVRKQESAKKKLGRDPSTDELILEYKGLLKSNTQFKDSALYNFRKKYDLLKSK